MTTTTIQVVATVLRLEHVATCGAVEQAFYLGDDGKAYFDHPKSYFNQEYLDWIDGHKSEIETVLGRQIAFRPE